MRRRPSALPAEAVGGRRGRLRSWLECSPGLRDFSAPLGARRTVSCRQCRCGLGIARDPVEVIVLAWRHRGHDHAGAGAVTVA